MSGGEKSVNRDGDGPPHFHQRVSELRKSEAAAGARFYGTEPIHLNYPQRHYYNDDGERIDLRYGCEAPPEIGSDVPTILTAQEDPAAVARVCELILEHRPEIILTHGGPMANPEHFCTQILVTRAYWKAVEQGHDGMLLNWHDLGVNLFGEAYKHWDTYIDISGFHQARLDATGAHVSQKPNPEKLDWPQLGPACNCGQAEVFTIVGRTRQPNQYGAFTLEVLQNEK